MADDYQGHARLKAQIKTCRITTGEHLYTRYEFRRLAEHNRARVWPPDIQWCGKLTELMRIAAIASAYDIEVIPHLSGSSPYATHFVMATPNSPWAEFFWPPAGGPPEVYEYWDQEHRSHADRRASTRARWTGPDSVGDGTGGHCEELPMPCLQPARAAMKRSMSPK